VVHYLALGGVLSYEAEGVDSASNLSEDAYKHRREDVRLSLYQEIPGLHAVKNIADLERLYVHSLQQIWKHRSDITVFLNSSTSIGEHFERATSKPSVSCSSSHHRQNTITVDHVPFDSIYVIQHSSMPIQATRPVRSSMTISSNRSWRMWQPSTTRCVSVSI